MNELLKMLVGLYKMTWSSIVVKGCDHVINCPFVALFKKFSVRLACVWLLRALRDSSDGHLIT